jgi:hypothetical protein
MHHQCKSVQSVSSVGNKPFPVRENVLHPSLRVAGRRILVLTVPVSRENNALGTCWRCSGNTAVPEWQYVASRGQESPATFSIVRVRTMC